MAVDFAVYFFLRRSNHFLEVFRESPFLDHLLSSLPLLPRYFSVLADEGHFALHHFSVGESVLSGSLLEESPTVALCLI
jgi:hypothetical protein